MSGTSEHITDSPSGRGRPRAGVRQKKIGLAGERLARLWRQIVGTGTVALNFLISLYTAAILLDGHPATGAVALVVFGAYFAICVLVHELGHAAAAWAVGVADLAAAKRILERYVKPNPVSNFDHRCTYAFAVAMLDGDGPRAAGILDTVPPEAATNSFSFWRARAATLHVLGRREEALAALRSARKAGGNFWDGPDEDDEAVFRAIEEGNELPRLEPRRRLSEDMIGPRRRTLGWRPEHRRQTLGSPAEHRRRALIAGGHTEEWWHSSKSMAGDLRRDCGRRGRNPRCDAAGDIR